MLIEDTKSLEDFCSSLNGESFIAIDTEFIRERTYWPRLCLVQIAGENEAVAIDPLSERINLAPLYDLLANPKILKVFHAARQDIEIFFNATGHVPKPIFDTQIAAMVCGFGEAASYEKLAAKTAKAKIDKTSRYTDWSRRPLTKKQIAYALNDVIHLRQIYLELKRMLKENGREEWMQKEMEALNNPETYKIELHEAWKKIKVRGGIKPKTLPFVRELAAWREAEAQRLDIPRGRVMRDETLIEIANHQPLSREGLSCIRGLPKDFAEGRQGYEILAIIERIKNSALPDFSSEKSSVKKGAVKSEKTSAAIVALLKTLLKKVSEEHGVAEKIIASSEDLEKLAQENEPDIPALHGWRRQLFGETALALKRGEIALAMKEGKVVILKTEQ